MNTTIVVVLAIVSIAFADDFPDCKCPEWYRPGQDSNGAATCFGTRWKSRRPCNIPLRPLCKCGPEATGIMGPDLSCIISKRGEIVKKWECENQKELDEYEEKYFKKNEPRSTTSTGSTSAKPV